MSMRSSAARFALVVLVIACGGSTTPSDATTHHPVVIDGVRGAGEWDDATSVPAFGGATFLYKTVGDTLFVALDVADPTLTVDDVLQIRFDDTRNGTFDTIEDGLSVTGAGAFGDTHGNGSAWSIVDEHPDGSAAAGQSGGDNFFEISHPLASGDAEDFSLQRGDLVGYCLIYFQDGTATSQTTFPLDCNAAGADLSGFATLVVQ
jgi:hypothetical protein